MSALASPGNGEAGPGEFVKAEAEQAGGEGAFLEGPAAGVEGEYSNGLGLGLGLGLGGVEKGRGVGEVGEDPGC